MGKITHHKKFTQVKLATQQKSTDQIELKDKISWWWITKVTTKAAVNLYSLNLLGFARLIFSIRSDIRSGKCYEKQTLSKKLTAAASMGFGIYIRQNWPEIKEHLLSMLI